MKVLYFSGKPTKTPLVYKHAIQACDFYQLVLQLILNRILVLLCINVCFSLKMITLRWMTMMTIMTMMVSITTLTIFKQMVLNLWVRIAGA